MNSLEWCKEKLDLTITDWCSDADFYVTTNSTADGYDIHIAAYDLKRLDWENEVFYYNDDEWVQAIIEAILDHGEGMTIYDGTNELEDNEYFWDELQQSIIDNEDE